MNKKKKVLKGFTLVELIVVIAIFGFLMAGILMLINPISVMYSDTAQQEAVAADLDNIKRYLEGTLRYADRMAVYTDTFVDAADPSKTPVETFSEYYKLTSDDTIYVMQIRNGDSTSMLINEGGTDYVSGEISLTTYAGDLSGVADYTKCVIDEQMFKDYAFIIKLGQYSIGNNVCYKNGTVYSSIPADPTDDKVVDAYLTESLNYNSDSTLSGQYPVPSVNNMTLTISAFRRKNSDYLPLETATTANFACLNLMNNNKVEVKTYSGSNVTNIEERNAFYGSFPNASTISSGNIWFVYTLPKRAVDY